jgi:hypothetical protein
MIDQWFILDTLRFAHSQDENHSIEYVATIAKERDRWRSSWTRIGMVHTPHSKMQSQVVFEKQQEHVALSKTHGFKRPASDTPSQ